ncbi:MAG: oxidoreductase [Micrococcales bacterium]|nr:oxidoreductase [Micrococcales bacterium]
MSWFKRRRGGESAGPAKESAGEAKRQTMAHLQEFSASRVGVEAYLEPPTKDYQTTLLLIATTGEWTRRKIPNAAAGREIAAQLGLPVYDVNFTGYPQRMRDWNAAQRAKTKRPNP